MDLRQFWFNHTEYVYNESMLRYYYFSLAYEIEKPPFQIKIEYNSHD